MLGVPDRLDTVAVPPFPFPRARERPPQCTLIPADGQTQFLRRYRDRRDEAYEWGGLTVGSYAKALWVLYLPFTLINAGGWAHRRTWAGDTSVPDGGVPEDMPADVGVHLWLTRVAAALATATYVLWVGYLLLGLVAVTWRDFVLAAGGEGGALYRFVDDWLPWIAPVAFAAIVVAFLWASTGWGQLERTGPQFKGPWRGVPEIASWKFFARSKYYERGRLTHIVLAVAVAGCAVGQYVAGWDRLGLAIILVAAVQFVVGLALLAVETVGRCRHPYADPDTAWPWPRLRGRVPAGATFVLVGSMLAHMAFTGLGLVLQPMLARWPEHANDENLVTGPELGSADVFGGFLLLLVALATLTTVLLLVAKPSVAESGVAVKLVRRAHMLVAAVLVSLLVPVGVYAWQNLGDVRGAGDIVDWYDQYEFTPSSPLQWVGRWVLVALPGLLYVALRGQHDTGVARVVGNVWDVLTFWPRRFHPLAAPCSAERAVPELRARIENITRVQGAPLAVAAHSQGSVLACAAVGSAEDVPREKLRLVTFGSPLGSLFAPTWPAYVPPLLAATRAKACTWSSFWRATDPIGGPVPGLDEQIQLSDPRAPGAAEYDEDRPLLERPLRAGATAGHSHYLTDPAVRSAIDDPCPSVPGSVVQQAVRYSVSAPSGAPNRSDLRSGANSEVGASDG